MVLKFAINITADAKGVAPATAEARKELASVKQEAAAGSAALQSFAAAESAARQESERLSRVLVGRVSAANENAAAVTSIGNAARLTSNQMLNLSRQGNDVITMFALGAPPMQIFASQIGQIYDALESGPQGLRGSLSAIRNSVLSAGAAFASFVGPIGLVAIGIGAAGAAVGAYALATREKVKGIDELLKEHERVIRALGSAYGDVAEKSKLAGNAGIASLQLGTTSTIAGLNLALTRDSKDLFDTIGRQQTPGKSAGGFFSLYNEFKPFEEAINKLRETAAAGKPDILAFKRMVEEKWASEPANEALTKTASKLVDLANKSVDAAEALRQLQRIQDRLANSRFPGLTDAREAQDYRDQNAASLTWLQRQQAAALGAIGARSPGELAAAAAASAAAKGSSDGDSAEIRAYREKSAAALAYAQAIHVITEAQRQRLRSLDETIASAQLDLVLVGKGAAEVAGLRMQHQLLAQVQAAAADAGVKADDAEIARIKQKSAEYARLQAAKSAREMLIGQGDDLERLRLEAALIGQNSTVRDRLIAQLQVEQEIRRQGIDQAGQEAQKLRAGALLMADMTAEIRKQSDAWDSIRSTGEGVIDRLVDSASRGFKDIGDAAADMAADITKTGLQLAVANPLKNWLFGGDATTLSDVGQMGGVLGRLLGRSGGGAANALASAIGGSSVGAMNVTAAVVNLNGAGGGIGGILGNLAGGSSAGTSGGLLALVGRAIKSVESGGSGGYGAIGPLTSSGDRAYGAYQVMGANLPSWTREAFGQSMSVSQFLGNSAAQDKVFEQQFTKLFQKFGNMNDAISAWFTGGPLSKNAGATDILGTTGAAYVERVNAAMAQLGSSATEASRNLGSFGDGLGKLGSTLGQGGGIGSGGGLGNSILGALFGGRTGWGQAGEYLAANPTGFIGLWDTGGFTGAGDKYEPAGVVHRGEFVMSAEATRAIGVGNLEKLHRAAKTGQSFAEGGYAAPGYGSSSGRAGGMPASGGGVGDVHVYPPSGVETKTQKRRNNKGGFDIQIIQRIVKDEMASGGYDDIMQSRWGASPVRVVRGSI